MIVPLICNGNTIFNGYEKLYSLCNVGGLISTAKYLITVPGLEKAAWNSLYQLHIWRDAYNGLLSCTSNFQTCGYDLGRVYNLITGFTVTGTTAVEVTDGGDSHLFIDAIIDGFGDEQIMSARDDLNDFLGLFYRYINGSFDTLPEVLEKYSEIKAKLINYEHNVDPLTVVGKVTMQYDEIMTRVKNFEACTETRHCGIILGELLSFVLN
jgi:hypothetical protein